MGFILSADNDFSVDTLTGPTQNDHWPYPEWLLTDPEWRLTDPEWPLPTHWPSAHPEWAPNRPRMTHDQTHKDHWLTQIDHWPHPELPFLQEPGRPLTRSRITHWPTQTDHWPHPEGPLTRPKMATGRSRLTIHPSRNDRSWTDGSSMPTVPTMQQSIWSQWGFLQHAPGC